MTSPKLSNDMMELNSFLEARNLFVLFILIVKLGSRSKVYLKSLRDLDLQPWVTIISENPYNSSNPYFAAKSTLF